MAGLKKLDYYSILNLFQAAMFCKRLQRDLSNYSLQMFSFSILRTPNEQAQARRFFQSQEALLLDFAVKKSQQFYLGMKRLKQDHVMQFNFLKVLFLSLNSFFSQKSMVCAFV